MVACHGRQIIAFFVGLREGVIVPNQKKQKYDVFQYVFQCVCVICLALEQSSCLSAFKTDDLYFDGGCKQYIKT